MIINIKRLEDYVVYFMALSLWIPAVSIPVIELQLFHLSSFLYLCLTLVKGRHEDKLFFIRTISFLLLYYISIFVILPREEKSISVLLYYLVYMTPCLLSVAIILLYKFETFSKGMFYIGWFFSFTSLIQFILNVKVLESLRVSGSFIIVNNLDRVALLFPEPSGLGHMAAVWIAIVFLLYKNKIISKNKVVMSTMLFLACFLSTKSASSIALAISLIVAISFSKIKISVGNVLIGIVFFTGMITISYYSLSFLIEERGDTLLFSIYNRFSTIFAVMLYFYEGNYGVGLGNNSDIVPYVIEIQDFFDINAFNIIEGINSLTFTRLYEEGVAFFFLITLCYFRMDKVRLLFYHDYMKVVFIASFLISTFLAGYRAYSFSWFYISLILIVYFYPKNSLKVLNENDL